MKKLKSIILAVLFLFGSHSLYGQFGVSADAESGFSSNVFANYKQLGDNYRYVQGYINYDYLNKTQGMRIFYRGDATFFDKYDYRSYQLHKVGFSYFLNVGERGNKFSAGLDGRTRLHTDDYKWYEFKQFYAFANFKMVMHNQLYGYAGYNFTLRDYDILFPYSFMQHLLFFRLGRFYNTGTSLIGEINFMQKTYLYDQNSDTVEGFSDITTEGVGSSQQMVGLLRCAQSLNEKTGISAQFLMRRNLLSSVRYLINDEGYYYTDEEIFDDIFGYESEEIQLILKRKLFWKINLSLGGFLLFKHYVNRIALDLEGYPLENEPLREDNRKVLWFSLSKTIKYSNNINPLTLQLDFSWLKNKSNDPYYKYDSRFFSFGLKQSL